MGGTNIRHKRVDVNGFKIAKGRFDVRGGDTGRIGREGEGGGDGKVVRDGEIDDRGIREKVSVTLSYDDEIEDSSRGGSRMVNQLT